MNLILSLWPSIQIQNWMIYYDSVNKREIAWATVQSIIQPMPFSTAMLTYSRI